jgi:hypothetical protein
MAVVSTNEITTIASNVLGKVERRACDSLGDWVTSNDTVGK